MGGPQTRGSVARPFASSRPSSTALPGRSRLDLLDPGLRRSGPPSFVSFVIGGNMTDLQVRPTPVVTKPKKTMGWLTPVVWGVVVLAIGGIIWAGSSAGAGSKILYDSQNSHNWFVDAIFNPTSVGQKVFVTIFAIVLFVLVMGVILWLIDRPRVPNGTVVAGFLGPVVIALAGGLLFSALKTIYESFRKFDQFGTDIGWTGLSNYTHFFTSAYRDTFINTVLWVFLVPIFATIF